MELNIHVPLQERVHEQRCLESQVQCVNQLAYGFFTVQCTSRMDYNRQAGCSPG